jgi:hypothetical protein
MSVPCICLVLPEFNLKKMVKGEKFALSSFISLNCSTCQPPKPQGLQAASEAPCEIIKQPTSGTAIRDHHALPKSSFNIVQCLICINI